MAIGQVATGRLMSRTLNDINAQLGDRSKILCLVGLFALKYTRVRDPVSVEPKYRGRIACGTFCAYMVEGA